MTHGLTTFQASAIIEQARDALELIEGSLGKTGAEYADAAQEAMRVALENQIRIAETLEKIKIEFDKFEDGINKIL